MNENDTFLKVNKMYFSLGLKSIDILILAQIDEFCRNGNDCYMTNEQLSALFGESTSTIKRTLDRLESLNIISRNIRFVEGNGRGNKQRILSINEREEWKVQNDTSIQMEGSNCSNGRFKKQEWKVHNGPIKDNLKENKKKTKEASSANAQKRRIEDLSDTEAMDIILRLSRKERYIDIQRQYNLEFGSVTKDFEKQWMEIKSARTCSVYEENTDEPKIDYTRIHSSVSQKTEEQLMKDRQRQSMFEELWGSADECEEQKFNSDDTPESIHILKLMSERRHNEQDAL